MYTRILVTLDQSPLAEQALPHALAMAEAFRAQLDLLTVVPFYLYPDGSPAGAAYPDGSPVGGLVMDWEAVRADAAQYLEGIASRVRESGAVCEVSVREGEIAEAILRYAQEHDCDMIVMSTHGRSGIGRWVYGSVADRVLRHSDVPVLLIRATDT